MIDLGKDWKELPSRVGATNMRAAREMDRPPSPDTQPPWKIPELVLCGHRLDGRIAVEGQDTRNFALDFDSFKREAIAAVKAGAAMVHIDTGGIAAIMQSGLSVPQIFDKVTGEINAEIGKDWVADGNICAGGASRGSRSGDLGAARDDADGAALSGGLDAGDRSGLHG